MESNPTPPTGSESGKLSVPPPLPTDAVAAEDISAEPAYSAARQEMETELRKWGVGLCAIGGISILLSGFLDPVWGGALIVLGLLSFVIRKSGMFIVFGCVLLLAGLMNLLGGGLESGGWAIFGVLQVFWGVQEFRRFAKFHTMLREEHKARA
jgi:hypothetical protein